MLEKRREAQRIIADHKQVLKDNLNDLVYSGESGGLVERILGLEEKLSTYTRTRTEGVAIPANLDLAERERIDAKKAHDEAVKDSHAAEAAFKLAEEKRRSANGDLVKLEAEKMHTERDLAGWRQSLNEMRKTETDEMLEKAFADAVAAYSDATHAVALIEAVLKELNPELVRERLESLGKAR